MDSWLERTFAIANASTPGFSFAATDALQDVASSSDGTTCSKLVRSQMTHTDLDHKQEMASPAIFWFPQFGYFLFEGSFE